jgi:hypothetical protein
MIPSVFRFLFAIALAAAVALPVHADCLETNAIVFLKIPRDTVGLRTVDQLIAVTDLLEFLCPGHDEEERADAVTAALRGLCKDWPCARRKILEPKSAPIGERHRSCGDAHGHHGSSRHVLGFVRRRGCGILFS